MAHRILPYPCFLWDEHYLAAGLGLPLPVLQKVFAGDSELRRLLDSVTYSGILSVFLGRRWWRAGLEAFLWDITQAAAEGAEPSDAILRLAGLKTEALAPRSVVVTGPDYRPLEHTVSAEDAVRIQPDDWPPFADDAWTTLELARENDRLGALVIEPDRALVEDA